MSESKPSKSAVEDLREGDHKDAMAPEDIFYDAGTGAFFVDVGSHFRMFTRKSPIMTGLEWHYLNKGKGEDDARRMAKDKLSELEVRKAVDWSGDLAGHKRGIIRHAKGSLLVTSEADLVKPSPGDFPLVAQILRDLVGHQHPQLKILLGWIRGGYEAIRDHVHQAAPMLAVAGPQNSGKSLLAWIVGRILGGRIGHPHAAWTGAMVWNDDLVGCELLLVDDSVGSSDYRKRLQFAARFKESIYGPEVQLRKRHKTSISVRPVWRVLFCVNDNPESLEVLPPVVDGMEDKMILLQSRPVTLPVDTSTPDGKLKLRKMIQAELPAFIDHLLNDLTLPDELTDKRGGVLAWRHPELVEAMDGIAPAQHLRELILLIFEKGELDDPWTDSVTITAAELESILTDQRNPTSQQARTLLRGARSIGRYLGELAKQDDELVTKLPKHNGIRRWMLTKPEPDGEDEDDVF